jgi:hypothetical protein
MVVAGQKTFMGLKLDLLDCDWSTLTKLFFGLGDLIFFQLR